MKNKLYYKLSHFSDMVLKMNNEQDKLNFYTDKQFEEDLEKWVNETKYKNSKQIGVNTITNSLGSNNNIIKTIYQPTIIVSPWT
jgi:hypothetical protein